MHNEAKTGLPSSFLVKAVTAVLLRDDGHGAAVFDNGLLSSPAGADSASYDSHHQPDGFASSSANSGSFRQSAASMFVAVAIGAGGVIFIGRLNCLQRLVCRQTIP